MKTFAWLAVALTAEALLGGETIVYQNDFEAAPGSSYPEWSSSGFTWSGNGGRGEGPQVVTTIESPNHARRFLGEFGGPQIVSKAPFVRVDETVRLTLKDLPAHTSVTVSFDLLILKSWDGNNPHYGPDHWSLKVANGPMLLDTTFSNNLKRGEYDLSLQNYPALNSPPQSGAAAVNTLGYKFYGDAIYRMNFTFAHDQETLELDFSSSLFEGKGLADESWGLGRVRVWTAVTDGWNPR